MNKNKSVQRIAMIGLFTALVFIASKIEIRIPSVLGVTRFHLGNGMCLLGGLLLGPLPGGLAAGIGSFLFDLVFWGGNPAGWLVTFASKMIMASAAGALHRCLLHKTAGTAAACAAGIVGELCYIAAYLLKEYITYRYIMLQPVQAVKLMLIEKLTTSGVNAVIAVIISTVLYAALKPVLTRNNLNYE